MAKNKKEQLPDICVLKVAGRGEQGDYYAVPTEKNIGWENCKIFMVENRRIKPALEVGDEFIGKVNLKKGMYWVKPIARTHIEGGMQEKVSGILEKREGKYYVRSSEKNAYREYLIDRIGSAQAGDFISVVLVGEKRYKQAFLIKNYGPFDLNKATAALVLDKYDIPYEFNEKIFKEIQKCGVFDENSRLNLTHVPLVTIDGADAKDFDDAVWAERTETGYHLKVAIADVSFYVRPGSELDREAYKRGNSVYLPNMVVPMLPEKLCNGLCSLMPNQKRASIVCTMRIDNDGNLLDYKFDRAIIKSAARLTYEEVQKALEGDKSSNIATVFSKVIEPVYEAYQALDKAKRKRGALDLEVDEVKVKVGKDGIVQSISKEINYTANKIVEEFMITANVAAALALQKSKLPVMYRVHDKPQQEKLKDIEPLLKDLGMKLPEQSALNPGHLNRVISDCEKKGYAGGISNLILRLQSQAQYNPENIGHFGLGLKDYVHFTSPIRRYADLLIHRALIKAFDMPDGGGLEDTASLNSFMDIGQHLSETERKAVNAERDLTARFISSYLQPAVGQDFEVKIVGLTMAGMFVRIESLGAEGLIPLSSMPDDDYDLVDGGLGMTSFYNHYHFRMGEIIKGRLMEASPITGGLIFKYIDSEKGTDYYERKRAKPHGSHFAMKRKSFEGPKKHDKAAKKKRIKEENNLAKKKAEKKCIKPDL